MQTKTNLGKIRERILAVRALKVSVAALFVFLLGFIIVPVLIAEASAESANLAVHWDTVSMVLDSDADDTSTDPGETGHGDIIFGGASGITPVDNNLAESGSSYGRLVVTKKRIGVATSGTYFSVYVSMADSSNSLIMDNTNLELEATSGTWDTPATFITNGGSGWGYAVPGTMIPRSSTVATAPDFSTSIASASILDQQLAYNTEGAATYYANSVWAAVPERNTPQLVWKESNTSNDNYGFGTYTVTNNGVSTQVVSPHSDTNDTRYKSFDIYYAVAVDTNVVAGTYSNQIVYTGMAAASSLDTVSTNLVRDIEFGGQNDVQTLRFDLNDSAASIAQNQITVALVPHATFVQNGYTIDNLTLADYDTCTITGFTRNTVEGYSELTCTMPEETPETGYGNGTFDYWVNIGGYNYNYVSKIQNTVSGDTVNVGAFVYAGLQSQYATATVAVDDGNGGTTNVALDNRSGTIVKEMQEMTPGICDLTNMWKNTTSIDARIMDYTGLVELADSSTDSATLGLGSFKLIDNRDSKPYLVRRLADGNCWMVQNLALDLADFAFTQNLTKKNTDIDDDYWDPAESAYEIALEIANDDDYTGPAVTQSNYFEIASLARLGSTQTYQFLPAGINDSAYYFGSNYKNGDLTEQLGSTGLDADGYPLNATYTGYFRNVAKSTSGLWIESNDNSRIPRTVRANVSDFFTGSSTDAEWQASNAKDYMGVNYTWWAAVADNNTEAGGYISHSICPSNWTMPADTTTHNKKGFGQLLVDSYRIFTTVNHAGRDLTRALPISFSDWTIDLSVSGQTTTNYTQLHTPFFYYWSNRTYAGNKAFNISVASDGNAYNGAGARENALTIRCVNKGSNQETVTPTTCSNGQICYNGNGADSGSTNSQTASSTADTVLTAPGYVRSGYAFAGWSTSPNGYGTIYGPNESIDATNLYTTVDDTTTATSSLQLYAKWIKSSGTMQEFTATQCTAMAEHEVIALTDNRDGNTYSIAKLKDGNCWMTSNLALNLAEFAGTKKLTSDNTDIGNDNGSNTALGTCSIGDDCYEAGKTTYYWNPSASMFTVAQEAVTANPNKYANASTTYNVPESELIDNATEYGLTYDSSAAEGEKFTVNNATTFANKFVSQQNYFYVASEIKLGQVQAKQFQSYADPIYYWATSASPANNGGTLREYQGKDPLFESYYDQYSATAESIITKSPAPDSICPSGWELLTPTKIRGMLAQETDFDPSQPENTNTVLSLRTLPTAYTVPGVYSFSGGGVYSKSAAAYYQEPSIDYAFGLESTNVVVQRYSYRTYGNAVRCIQDTE